MSRVTWAVTGLLTGVVAMGAGHWADKLTVDEPVTVECSIDDTLVFVAYGATAFRARDGMVAVNTEDGRMFRRMQENETCREVSK